MATTEDRLRAFAQGVGLEFKNVIQKIGDTTALETVDKTNIVAAINEVLAKFNEAGNAIIDDTAGNGVVDRVWSANKSYDAIVEAINQVKSDLINGAPEALDTFKELADAMANDTTFATSIAQSLGKRVRVDDVQTFTIAEKLQGRENIGAASDADLTDLKNAIGATDVDYVAIFQAAKA